VRKWRTLSLNMPSTWSEVRPAYAAVATKKRKAPALCQFELRWGQGWRSFEPAKGSLIRILTVVL
jgi:hypothetical protein